MSEKSTYNQHGAKFGGGFTGGDYIGDVINQYIDGDISISSGSNIQFELSKEISEVQGNIDKLEAERESLNKKFYDELTNKIINVDISLLLSLIHI